MLGGHSCEINILSLISPCGPNTFINYSFIHSYSHLLATGHKVLVRDQVIERAAKRDSTPCIMLRQDQRLRTRLALRQDTWLCPTDA